DLLTMIAKKVRVSISPSSGGAVDALPRECFSSFVRRGRGGQTLATFRLTTPSARNLESLMRAATPPLEEGNIGTFLSAALLYACLLTVLLANSAAAQGVMYAGVWPNDILIMDEASGSIQDRIHLKNGAAFSLTRSPDRKKFYAVT